MAKSATTASMLSTGVAALKSTTALTPSPGLLPDGIYIGLPASRYHADPALGSSMIRDLLKGANLFWHKSAMNPKRPKESKTPAKILGSAVHTLLLDGQADFDRDYVRGPYGPDDDITPAEKSALTKASKAKLLQGQELLSQEDYDFVLGCKAVVDMDPELQGSLDNGLSEVSVFWTRADGVRCKARFDKLKVAAIGDIKTIANERERPLDQACLLDISTYRYDIPVAHYQEGRRQMASLFEAGKVFIGDEIEAIPMGPKLSAENKRLIDFIRECATYKNPSFLILFIPKKGAPDAWAVHLAHNNEIALQARTDVEIAIDRYKAAMDKYGTTKRWLPGHVIEELTIDMLPFGFGRVKQVRR
jgi:hypothetical protein